MGRSPFFSDGSEMARQRRKGQTSGGKNIDGRVRVATGRVLANAGGGFPLKRKTQHQKQGQHEGRTVSIIVSVTRANFGCVIFNTRYQVNINYSDLGRSVVRNQIAHHNNKNDRCVPTEPLPHFSHFGPHFLPRCNASRVSTAPKACVGRVLRGSTATFRACRHRLAPVLAPQVTTPPRIWFCCRLQR